MTDRLPLTSFSASCLSLCLTEQYRKCSRGCLVADQSAPHRAGSVVAITRSGMTDATADPGRRRRVHMTDNGHACSFNGRPNVPLHARCGMAPVSAPRLCLWTLPMRRRGMIPISARHHPVLGLPSPPNVFGGEGSGVGEIRHPQASGILKQRANSRRRAQRNTDAIAFVRDQRVRANEFVHAVWQIVIRNRVDVGCAKLADDKCPLPRDVTASAGTPAVPCHRFALGRGGRGRTQRAPGFTKFGGSLRSTPCAPRV